MPSLRTLLITLPIIAIPLCACSSSSGPSATSAAGTCGSALVYPTDATLRFKLEGPMISLGAPDGGTAAWCALSDNTYTQELDESYSYVIATTTLSWSRCKPNASGTTDTVSSSRPLSATESASLMTTLAGVKTACKPVGGADAPGETIEIHSSSAVTYESSEDYSGGTSPGAAATNYVDGLEAVIDQLQTLAK